MLGVGALGSNLAANLASDLRNEIDLTILYFDTVEERNVLAGTQFYMPDQISQSKVEALQYNIYRWYGKEIQIINENVNKVNLINYDLIIDCFDNYEARKYIQDMWSNTLGHDTDLLHCGFSDKLTFEISWAHNYEIPDDNPKAKDVCEMQGAGSFVKMVAGIASRTVVEYVTNDEKRYFIGNRFSVREIV